MYVAMVFQPLNFRFNGTRKKIYFFKDFRF